ncbi:diacylglycerol/lipid kinase family protein [Paenibacillus polymyxa]|uniref:diacylglycerol/lipid kinase family protein n=1 Tax=Paenibacillus TaxID=44249 RepID=UPI000F50D8BE|nr:MULTISPECIES: diacylglycerol kinase family protein [Paenibacillus]KAF6657215.1 diacylglycerol kinase family lipid kinase [Paenibacillus sp. EKM301P]MDG0054851.1 diacylglycerol kinase family lipid kinase [Paenibacillus sp. P2(2022)]MEE4578669.1 diacylglycerol kinase family protein [Paenibacillus polymyxa]RPD97356.1 diacylglycerol kinase family lipid kinase [Paenibacillus polymyxa]UBS87240.1 diacylglycerol kinase family lipid kinase [Paenibacillus polymyxa]
MKKAMVIVNPSSGKEESLQHVRNVEEILREQGYAVTVEETARELDATRFCVTACQETYDLVVSLGGDGTLHETINGFMDQDHRPKLGVIPLGTVNDFARALQIPLNPELAIRTLTSARVKAVDMGLLNGRMFANVVATGSLAESLSAVSSDDKSMFGTFAYIKEGMKELINHPAHPLIVRYDDKTWEGESPLFLAALTNSVGGFEKLVPGAAVDDGLLHCFIFKNLNILNTVTASISLFLGNLKDHKDVVYFTAKHVSVSSAESVSTNVDGEEGPSLPIEVRILPRHIEVIVPEESE